MFKLNYLGASVLPLVSKSNGEGIRARDRGFTTTLVDEVLFCFFLFVVRQGADKSVKS